MLPAQVLDLLRQWWKARPTAYDAGLAPEQRWLFPGRSKRRPLTTRQFGRLFKQAAKAAGLEQIVTKNPTRRDRYRLAGDTLYLHLPDGAGESKFTAQTVDRVLGVTATARNWNTVLKLHAMSAR